MKKNKFYIAALMVLATSVVALPSCSMLGGQNASSQQGTTMVYTAPPRTEPPTTEAPTTVPVKGTATTEDENGVTRYYVNGELQTDTVVEDENEQHFYVGSDGTVDHGYCDGVTVGEEKWIVIEGSAYPVNTESDEVLFAAAQAVAKCTDSSMKREDKKDGYDAAAEYEKVTRGRGKAGDCIKCGRCEKHCPQTIPVRKFLEDISKELD